MLLTVLLFITASLATSEKRLGGNKKQMLLGGRKDADINEPEMKRKLEELSSFALAKIAEKRASENNGGLSSNKLSYSLVRIVSAQTQVVAGTNYFIKLRMKEAECKKQCKIELCDLSVYVVSWLNKTELTDHECKQRQSNLLGGRMAIDAGDENALQAANFAVKHLSMKSNSLYHLRLIALTNAQRQIVNGINYFLTFSMGQTKCTKSELLDESKCQVEDETKGQKCSVTVLDQPWNESGPRYTLTRDECTINNQ